MLPEGESTNVPVEVSRYVRVRPNYSHKVIPIATLDTDIQMARLVVNSLSKSIIIGRNIRDWCTRSDQGRLRLSSLALLATLVGGLFLLHLLVAQSSEGARNFLYLVARQVPGQLLDEFLEEEGVVSLLVAIANDWDHCAAELLELHLGMGVEKREAAQVDGASRILGVDRDGGNGSKGLSSVGYSDSTKKVFSVMEVSLLLSAAKTLATLGFGLVLFARGVIDEA